MHHKNSINKLFLNQIFKLFLFIAIVWSFFLVSFLLGYYVYSLKIWPYEILDNVQKFVQGDLEENTTLTDKLLNDFKIKPSRLLGQYIPTRKNFKTIKSLPLKSRRDNPKIFLSDTAMKGFRAIYGVFDFEKMLHGLILINPEGKIIKHWETTQNDVDWLLHPDALIYPHGLEIDHDGSFVITYDYSTSLTKYNYCGEIQWRVTGVFDHVISFGDDHKTIWVSGKLKNDLYSEKNYFLLKIDYSNGKVLKKIFLKELVDKNKDIGIFALNQNISKDASTYIKDPFHFNDVDPLPKDLASKYPLFKSGDLLLSFRNLNLICVVDPNTLKVKWWIQGVTRRQHDPDWNKRGTITVFNNNMFQPFSNIVEINPNDYSYSNVVKGSNYNFYSRVLGKHQELPDGSYLITSAFQGRVFEVNPKGDIDFEFVNTYDESKEEVLMLSQAYFLPENYFDNLPICK